MGSPASSVPPKEVLILGPSGSGKSVLMNRMKEIYSNYGVYAAFPPYVATVGVDVATVSLPQHVSTNRRKGTVPVSIDIREVGGSLSARWKSYIPHCSYIVYTVDISDPTQFSTAFVLLHEVLATWAEIKAKAHISGESRDLGSSEPGYLSMDSQSLFCSQWSCIPSIPTDEAMVIAPSPPLSAEVRVGGPGRDNVNSTALTPPASSSTRWTSLTDSEKKANAGAEDTTRNKQLCHRERPKLILAFTKTDVLGGARTTNFVNATSSVNANISNDGTVEDTSTRGATGVTGDVSTEPYELSRPVGVNFEGEKGKEGSGDGGGEGDEEDQNSYLCRIDEIIASSGLNDCLQCYTGLFESYEIMYGTSYVAPMHSIKSTKTKSSEAGGAAAVLTSGPTSSTECIKETLAYQICSWLRYN